jgi:hypothetical protein
VLRSNLYLYRLRSLVTLILRHCCISKEPNFADGTVVSEIGATVLECDSGDEFAGGWERQLFHPKKLGIMTIRCGL